MALCVGLMSKPAASILSRKRLTLATRRSCNSVLSSSILNISMLAPTMPGAMLLLNR